LQQIVARMPPATLADFQKGDAVMIVSTEGTASGGVTAITLLGGVEPILAAPSGSQAAMSLSPWNIGGGGGEDAGAVSALNLHMSENARYVQSITGKYLIYASFRGSRPAYVCLVFASRLPAQTATGTLRGTLVDPSGGAVPNATVQATSATGQTVSANTNATGAYELSNLPAGPYTIQVTACPALRLTKKRASPWSPIAPSNSISPSTFKHSSSR
jgi:hypothetical protein